MQELESHNKNKTVWKQCIKFSKTYLEKFKLVKNYSNNIHYIFYKKKKKKKEKQRDQQTNLKLLEQKQRKRLEKWIYFNGRKPTKKIHLKT